MSEIKGDYNDSSTVKLADFDVGELEDIPILRTDVARRAEPTGRFLGLYLEINNAFKPTYSFGSNIFDDGLVQRLSESGREQLERSPFIISIADSDVPPEPDNFERVMSRREACAALKDLPYIDEDFAREMPPLPEGAPEFFLEVIEIPGPSIDPCIDPCSDECLDIVEPRYDVAGWGSVEVEETSGEAIEEAESRPDDSLIDGGYACWQGMCECPKPAGADSMPEFIYPVIKWDEMERYLEEHPDADLFIHPVIKFDELEPPCIIYL